MRVAEGLVLEEIEVAGFEKVLRVRDGQVGLDAIICIHSTALGPALGGTRMYAYKSFEEALRDATRLARGMTYKSALSQSGWGGGKSVIIGDPKQQKTPELLAAFGQAVDRLQGEYICAEDSGTTPEDMAIISRETPYVVGLLHEKSSGNPSPFTAWGVFRGIQSVCKWQSGSDSVEGKTIAIQGLGSVGTTLADILFWQGARLIVADIDLARAIRVGRKYGAQVVGPEEIVRVPCDVFSPCALGGVLSFHSITEAQCGAVAGAANNQLLNDEDADFLASRNILLAPDFVINAGGLINVTAELAPGGYDAVAARLQTHQLYDQLITIYEIAQQNSCSTYKAALSLGEYRLKYGIGKRTVPPCFHHAI